MTPLTPVEHDLARLVARGYSPAEIADELGWSHGTVNNATSAAAAKLSHLPGVTARERLMLYILGGDLAA